MKSKDWEKQLDKFMSDRYGLDSKIMGLEDFIKDLLFQSNQEIVKEIDKDLIGELAIIKTTEPYYFQNMNPIPKEQYEFLLEQRQKLTQLRQSNNLLGEK